MDGRSWPVSLALAIALSLLRGPIIGLFHNAADLEHFFDRAIGMATLAGVDSSGYAHGFIRLQVLLALVSLVAYGGARWLRRWIDGFATVDAPEHRWIARLTEIWAALAIYDVFFPAGVDLRPLTILLAFLSVLAIGVLIIRNHRWFASFSMIEPLRRVDRSFLVATLFWPVPAFFVVWVVTDRPLGFQGAPTAMWYTLWALLWLLTLWLVGYRLARTTGRAESTRLMASVIPWLLVPASLPLANEVQAAFRSLDPRRVALVLILLLVASTVGLYHWNPLRRHASADVRRSVSDRLLYVYFGLTVFTVGLLRFHPSHRHLGNLDYFHLGESVLPTQQLLQFSKVPLLDLRLTHTFSDMAYEWLYAMFHGVQGLDLLIWSHGLKNLVGLMLAYFVLARIFSPGYALLACLFLPVLSTFRPYYAIVLLPAIFLAKALRRPTTARFVALACALVAVLLWRIDFGLAASVAAAGVVGLHLLRGAHRRRAAARAAAWMVSGFVVSIATARLLAGPRLFETIGFFFQSYSYRLLTRTRPEVIESYTAAAVLQYYLVPAVALLYIVVLTARQLLQRRWVSTRLQLLTFLAAFSLVISVRSMERHSLIEAFNPYLSVLLLALLPLLFQRNGGRFERPSSRAVFAAVLVTTSLFALPPARQDISSPLGIALRQGDTLFRFHRFQEGEPRVRFADGRHRALLDFLDRHLEPDETFFDFSNAPLLYALAEREFPTYIIPNLLQTSETVQARTLRDLSVYAAADRLPLVIFKQGNAFWDATDGVPNEVRCYRVAEWLYENYRPAAAVGKYQIWWRRNRLIPWPTTADTREWTLESTSSAEEYGATANFQADGAIRVVGKTSGGHVFGIFDTTPLPDLYTHNDWQVELRMESTADEPIQMFFGFDDQYFAAESHAWFLPEDAADGIVTLEIPGGQGRQLTDLRFDPPQGSTLTIREVRVRGRGSSHRPLRDEELAQNFDLDALPAIWARHDPLKAATTTRILADLLDEPVEMESGEPLDLRFPEDLIFDVALGAYLHLEIRTEDDAAQSPPTISLTWGEPASSFSFALLQDRSGRDDYLVRLSTQWRWWQGNVDGLELRTDRSVIVESAVLRGGD